MDSLTIVNTALKPFFYLFPMLVVIGLLKSSWFKGVAGELIVNFLFKFSLDKEIYHLVKNVTLPTEDGSTQIDHLIVSEFGVFVVETKNMKGWIFGGVKQKAWTQKIYRHSSQFQNPLHQNYKHVKTLQLLLGLDENQVHSLIVFVGNFTFKTNMPENVTSGRACIRFIKSKKMPVLKQAQISDILQKIEQKRLTPSYKTNREHIKHVKDIVSANKNSLPPNCPQCQAVMVLKKAKKGRYAGSQFWSCTTFPQCKGIVRAD